MKPGIALRRMLWALIVVGLLLALPVTVSAGSAVLAWEPNTEATIAGYNVHVGALSQTYTQTYDAGHVTTFTVSDLLEGQTYYFAITAYDIYANESVFSAEVSTTIATAPPVEPDPEPTPEPENSPPGASFTSSCSDLICSFTNTSIDSDGSVAASSWDFGEGASSTEQSPSHTYASDGTYTITLVVTDDDGATDTTSQGVTVTSSSGTEPAPEPEPTCKRGKSCDHSQRWKPKKSK